MAIQIAQTPAVNPRMDAARKFMALSLASLSSFFLGVVHATISTRAVFSNLLQIPFTCIGMICINVGFFHIIHEWGWVTSGITLIILEAMIADKDDA